MFQLDEVYKACCFKPHLRKNPVAKTSKELVCFFCRSARFAVLQVLFSWSAEVAAGLSNLKSAGARAGPHSLHRSEGFSHPGAPGGLEGLPGDPIGLHETFGTLLKALGVAFRCYPGSKLRALRSREPEPHTARFQSIVAFCCSKLLEPSRAEAAPSRGDSASFLRNALRYSLFGLNDDISIPGPAAQPGPGPGSPARGLGSETTSPHL